MCSMETAWGMLEQQQLRKHVPGIDAFLMLASNVGGKACFTLVITWLLVVPCFLGYTQSNDPILKYICSQDIGRLFWKDLMQCNVVLNPEFLLALTTCIPASTLDEAESTRVYICSCPEKWVKMMECLNMHLIQLQDDKNPRLEVGPSAVYRECVSVLVQEAEHSVQTGEPFLPESSFENSNLTKPKSV